MSLLLFQRVIVRGEIMTKDNFPVISNLLMKAGICNIKIPLKQKISTTQPIKNHVMDMKPLCLTPGSSFFQPSHSKAQINFL